MAVDLLQRYASGSNMPAIFGEGDGWAVEWENASGEEGRPWDIRCLRGDRTVYVEVKSTTVVDSHEFYISTSEVAKAKEASTDYFIMRVLAMHSKDRRVVFHADPWDMLVRTSAQLVVRLPAR
jgi:Holliday junction resolvase